MTIQQYKATLKSLKADLAKLEPQEAELTDSLLQLRKRKAELEAAIRSFARLCGERLPAVSKDPTGLAAEMGLTDAVRAVLKGVFPERLTPLEIRARLISAGYSRQHTNLMASIHTTLRRLENSGEINPDKKGKKTAYQWNAAIDELMKPVIEAFGDE